MTQLPQFVRRLPYVFYLLAVIVGGWRFWNEWSLAAGSFQYADAAGVDYSSVTALSRSTALYWGVVEAAYLISSGAFLHVLIAIYDKIGGSGE